ncbi:beta-lactamase [Apiospora aurea]|uniref:Beta-lactamase n=1 Tax=Apiospora aurea TaxID=335848 RepID=A0ABR1Q935_9PEZI
MAQAQGTCDPRFAKVRTLFQSFLDSGAELGASLTVNLAGETILDLYGGHADAARTRAWERDTVVPLASSTKTVSALAVLLLVDRGAIASVHDKVCKYWPEFAANGKEEVEIRHLLAHTSGVAGWEGPISVEEVCDRDSDATARLAGQAPWWVPGTASAYHAWNYGHLLGEVVRRVAGGTRLKEFVAREIAAPLGADFQIGLRAEDEGRMAEFVAPPPSSSGGGGGGLPPGFEPGPLFVKAIANPAMPPDFGRTRAWREGEVGASNGVGNARGLNAILSNITLAGFNNDDNEDQEEKKYLLSKPTVDLIFEEQSYGPDLAVGQTIRFGIGYALRGDADGGREKTWVDDRLPAGRIAYWGGSGGSLGIMDVDRGLTITYAMNLRSTSMLGNPASTAYIRAIYEALGVEI